ncbi:MAG: hypothetical protein ACFFD1_16130 [Candidatus Thorarchaeota archaeon]
MAQHQKNLNLILILILAFLITTNIFISKNYPKPSKTLNNTIENFEDTKYEESEPRKINLTYPSGTKMLYYDTGGVIIGVSLDELRNKYSNEYLNKKYPILDKITANKTTITSETIGNKNQADFEATLSSFLKNGNCIVFDKHTGKNLKYILQADYEYKCQGLCGSGGYIYKTPSGIKIFAVMTWIS